MIHQLKLTTKPFLWTDFGTSDNYFRYLQYFEGEMQSKVLICNYCIKGRIKAKGKVKEEDVGELCSDHGENSLFMHAVT